MQNLGTDWDERVLPSIGNEIVKAVVARYNAEQLLTQRDKVSKAVSRAAVEIPCLGPGVCSWCCAPRRSRALRDVVAFRPVPLPSQASGSHTMLICTRRCGRA